jgi:WD40 repeat protein
MVDLCRVVAVVLSLAAGSAGAQKEVFHGWSKDGTWLVFESRTSEDLVEFFFCATEQGATPTWPSPLPEMDQADERSLSCVRFTDPNRLPLGWRKLLVLGAPSMKSASLRVLSELVTDGESPGFQLESGDKKQVCSSTSVRDDSILGSVWWHPNGRWVMATIDGTLRHCQVTLKASGRPKRK